MLITAFDFRHLTRLIAFAALTAPNLLSSVQAAEPTTTPSAFASAPEADRKAILAMAGTYDVKFSFVETIALKAGYQLKKPDELEAQELVIVIADEGKRIDLQHVLVDDDMVIKHWRQEWTYENNDLFEYTGRNNWRHRTLTADEAKGTWTQKVFNVDDSPRYEGFGRWEHGANWTAWESNETWRPLPRREYTTRNDYQVIIGRNRHLLTPTGWVHEQDNAKVVLNDANQPAQTLVLERGTNTYSKSDSASFTPATAFWKKQAPFWTDVRAAWDNVRAEGPTLRLNDQVDGKRLYEALEPYEDAATPSAGPERRKVLEKIIRSFVSAPSASR